MSEETLGEGQEELLEIGPHRIVLKTQLDEDQLAPIFDDEWTASMVWEASVLLSLYLQENNGSWQPQDKRVIELGSGWCVTVIFFSCK